MESRGILLLRPYLSLLLILPTEDTGECAEIKSMIREINDTQVSEEEILSYSLYYYDREEGKITML